MSILNTFNSILYNDLLLSLTDIVVLYYRVVVPPYSNTQSKIDHESKLPEFSVVSMIGLANEHLVSMEFLHCGPIKISPAVKIHPGKFEDGPGICRRGSARQSQLMTMMPSLAKQAAEKRSKSQADKKTSSRVVN